MSFWRTAFQNNFGASSRIPKKCLKNHLAAICTSLITCIQHFGTSPLGIWDLYSGSGPRHVHRAVRKCEIFWTQNPTTNVFWPRFIYMKASPTATAILFLMSSSWNSCNKQFAYSAAITSASLQRAGAAKTDLHQNLPTILPLCPLFQYGTCTQWLKMLTNNATSLQLNKVVDSFLL